MLALHDLLHSDRSDDVERHPGVVAFAMSGSILYHRVVPSDAGLLRSARYVVDIRSQRDHRLAFAPGREPSSRNTGNSPLDLEAFSFENSGQVFRSLELLEPQLPKAEDAVDHYLGLLLHAIDLAGQIRFHRGLPGLKRSSRLLGESASCSANQGKRDGPHKFPR